MIMVGGNPICLERQTYSPRPLVQMLFLCRPIVETLGAPIANWADITSANDGCIMLFFVFSQALRRKLLAIGKSV